jgi:hypothetical protein
MWKIISTTYHLEQTKTDKKLILQSNENKKVFKYSLLFIVSSVFSKKETL